MNRSDKGLNLSGSWQQGHSATYNTPVAYLSRLQRILPAARWKLRFRAARATCPTRVLRPRHVPLGAIGPYCGSAIGRRAHASLLARILT
ncbi:hypothetical protein V6N13_028699 [Hibiscus sabdariffa]